VADDDFFLFWVVATVLAWLVVAPLDFAAFLGLATGGGGGGGGVGGCAFLRL
jgi:hypothetical protein